MRYSYCPISFIKWDNEALDLSDSGCRYTILSEGQYMMEIKVANSMPMGLAEKLSELSIFPVSFSKYGREYVDMVKRTVEDRKPEALKAEEKYME